MALDPTHHLTPEELAAYLARQVTEDQRAAMEEHLASCDECREDLIEASAVPGKHGQWMRRGLFIVPLAAAAILATITFVPHTPVPDPVGEAPRLRGGETEGSSTIGALEPGPDVNISAQSLTFRWNSAGADAFYNLTLTDRLGEILWSASTADTALVAPDSINLSVGDSYFWYVDALLTDARTATTGIREFTPR